MRKALGRRFEIEFYGDHPQKFVEFLEGQVSVRFLAPAEAHVDPHLVAVGKKLHDLLGPHFKIVPSGREADPHPLQLALFLFLPVLALDFLVGVFEFAELGDFADRRLGVR